MPIKSTKKSRLYDLQPGTKAQSQQVDDDINQLVSAQNDIVDDLTDHETRIVADAAALATHKSSADHDGRYYTETEVDAKDSSLQTQITSGAGNLTTHKSSADHDGRYYTEVEIDSKQSTHNSSADHDGRYYTESEINTKQSTHNVSADHDGRYYTEVEIDTKVNDLAGAGRTNQTIKSTYDDLQTHKGSGDHDSRYYTKTNMQTAGQASIHWDNLTNVPNMADPHFKGYVATYNDLPTTSNAVDDVRVVTNDGDGKQAMYICIATSGTIAQQWGKIGDLDWTNDHGSLVGLNDDDHLQYLRHDGTRAMTGDLNLNGYQLKNMVFHNSPTALSNPVVGKVYYDTTNNKLMLYKSTGWVDISGEGAFIRDKEFTATAGQTVFDLSSVGSYQTGTNALFVFKNGTLMRENQYTETSSTVVTLGSGASLNDIIYIKWFENVPSVLNAIESVLASATYSTAVEATAPVISLPVTAKKGQLSVSVLGNTYTNPFGDTGDFETDSNADGIADFFTAGNAVNSIPSLDSADKAYGSKSQKVVLTTGGYFNRTKSLTTIVGHKYYFSGYAKSTLSANNLYIGIEASGGSSPIVQANTGWKKYSQIYTATSTSHVVGTHFNGAAEGTFWLDGWLIIDLTALGLDTLTLAECDARFNFVNVTKSTLSQRVKAVGKNLFNKAKVTNGYYVDNTNGTLVALATYSASEFIPILPNAQYTKKGNYIMAFYDANKNYISGYTNASSPQTFTTPINAKYARISVLTTTLDTEQLELGAISTTYEPYTESVMYTPNNIELRAVGSGSTVAKDEINVTDGKYIKRNGSKPLSGTDYDILYTGYTNVDVIITTTFTDNKAWDATTKGLVDVFGKQQVDATTLAIDTTASIGKFYTNTNQKLGLIVAKGAYADIAAARTGLGSITLIYQLASPITTNVPIQLLDSNPNGMLIVEPVVKYTGVYVNRVDIPVTVKSIESVTKIANDNTRTAIDLSKVTLASDGLSFIITGAVNDERYEYTAFTASENSALPTIKYSYATNLIAQIENTGNTVNSIEKKLNNTLQIVNDIDNRLNSNIVKTPTVTWGMNNIRHNGDVSVYPSITMKGMSYVNLLGKDGNCEDTSKWSVLSATLALDSSNKVFGSNSIKITLSSTTGAMYKNIFNLLNSGKYYFVTASVKNGNATNVYIDLDTNDMDRSASVVTNTNFTTNYFKVAPTDFDTATIANLRINVNGASGQYVYVDGIMVIEISASDYALSDADLLAKYPYIDSYAALQNPYFEVRHDNLVRNGNGEEGVGWWTVSGVVVPTIENGKFKLVATSSSHIYQDVVVKPNTVYCLSANVTGPNAAIQVFTPTYSVIKTGIGTFNSGSNSVLRITMNLTAATTGYFDSIMLIEGTTAPSSYKPCRIERFVAETTLTSDDTITIDKGEVSGQLWWKHRILFGKDYDWQYNADYTGYKTAVINNFDVRAVSPQIPYGVKYDGKIIVFTNGAISSGDYGTFNSASNLYITLSDTDTGCAEAINPNNDEIKAFMNGWKATANDGTRYTAWVSVVDGTTTPASQTIDYVKANIAPNYEGYQFHYKLSNPEPITNANCHVHGDIWKLDVGDNYVTLDAGIVLGEVANTVSANSNMYIGYDLYTAPEYSPLKYKAEKTWAIYKNGVYDTTFANTSNTNDNDYNKNTGSVGYDPSATYTVDYKILATIVPQAMTSLVFSYAQDVFSALNSVAEIAEEKQQRDSALDRIVDLSLYEEFPLIVYTGRFNAVNGLSAGAGCRLNMNYAPKKINSPIPKIKFISAYYINDASGAVTMSEADWAFTIGTYKGHFTLVATYVGGNATIRGCLLNNGGDIRISVSFDCRGRI